MRVTAEQVVVQTLEREIIHDHSGIDKLPRRIVGPDSELVRFQRQALYVGQVVSNTLVKIILGLGRFGYEACRLGTEKTTTPTMATLAKARSRTEETTRKK